MSDYAAQNIDEIRLLRLFRCLDDSDKNDHLRDLSCHLLKFIPIGDYSLSANPKKEASDELKEALEHRLHGIMPCNAIFADLHDYDYHPIELSWIECGIILDLLLGTVSKDCDDNAVDWLINEYLRATEEFDIPLQHDFDNSGDAYEVMVEDLHNKALDLVAEWREKIISRIEKYEHIEKEEEVSDVYRRI